jgi:hypothetical protein
MKITAKGRTAAYSFLLAVQPLAVAYGLTTQDLSVLWVNAIAAAGGAVLALCNITPDEDGKHEAK